MSNDKSKKRKDKLINKIELWNIFDNEVNKKEPLECIYRSCGDREICENCETILAFSD